MRISPKDIQGIFSGEIFRREEVKQQYPLLGMIVALIFVYILAGYNSDKQVRHMSDLKREVRDKKFEYLTIQAEMTDRTRQSAVSTELKARGSALRENTSPVIVVE